MHPGHELQFGSVARAPHPLVLLVEGPPQASEATKLAHPSAVRALAVLDSGSAAAAVAGGGHVVLRCAVGGCV